MAKTSDLVAGLALSSRACVKLIDIDGRLAAMNRPGLDLLEIDDFAIICGQPWSGLWPKDMRATIDSAIEACLEGRSSAFVAFCPTAKGKPRWWEVTVVPIKDDAGQIIQILSTSYDITEMRLRQQELEQQLQENQQALSSLAEQLDGETQRLINAQARARHADQLKVLGQFVGHVVHDVNNVFSVLQSAARVLRRQSPDSGTIRVLEEVDKSLDHGTALVRRLLEFARTKGPSADEVDPVKLIAADLDLLRHLAGTSAQLKFEHGVDTWTVLADKSHFQSVLFNLVANARDALGEGGSVTIRVANCAQGTEPSLPPEGDFVEISVEDDGCGMAPDVQARAGEAFFTTKSEGKGTGLGLASAYELAERCGGRVVIDSAPGDGTTVTIYLPRAVKSASSGRRIPTTATRSTILIVKRDEVARHRLARWLRKWNFVVLEASSQSSALAALIRGVSIDLVIADSAFAAFDNHELFEALRRHKQDLSFIFILSDSEAQPPAGSQVIARPVTEDALNAAVHDMLGLLPAQKLSQRAISWAERLLTQISDPVSLSLLRAWVETARSTGRVPRIEDLGRSSQTLGDLEFLFEIASWDDASATWAAYGSAISAALPSNRLGHTVGPYDESSIGPTEGLSLRAARGLVQRDRAAVAVGGLRGNTTRLFLPLSANGLIVTHVLGRLETRSPDA